MDKLMESVEVLHKIQAATSWAELRESLVPPQPEITEEDIKETYPDTYLGADTYDEMI